MVTPLQVVAEARRWLGTPWQHQGRLLGQGVDCVGVVIGVAHALGLSQFDLRNYRRQPEGDALLALCDAHMQRVALAALQPGHVLLMRVNRSEPQHLGVVAAHPCGGLALIHATALGPRKCVEHRLDAAWQGRAVAAYALPGVCYE